MPFFTAPDHYDILAFLIQLAVLLAVARTLGSIAQKLGQPSVIGELLGGILLGPSLLGNVSPALTQWIVPHKPFQGYLIETVSLIGAIFLLLITGLETDVALIRRKYKMALGSAVGGLILPLLGGFYIGQILPENLLTNPQDRLICSFFLAIALSISSIPVLAKVLIDLNWMRRNIGQTIIAAGMIDDTVGWILLSILSSVALGHGFEMSTVLWAVGSVVVFLILNFTIGKWFITLMFNFVQDFFTTEYRLLTLTVVMTFGSAAITHALKLEPMFGAFLMGMVLGQLPRFPKSLHDTLKNIAIGIFAPIFFAVAGLKVNIFSIFQPQWLGLTLLVLAVAILTKLIGVYIGARFLARCDRWTSLSFGIGLNARGALGIIVASIGLSLGILSQEIFSIIVLMCLVTTLISPALLRWAFRHVHPDEEEAQRIEKEKLEEESFMKNVHRILVPVRRRENNLTPLVQLFIADILKKLNHKLSFSVTLMTVADRGKISKSKEFINRISTSFTQKDIHKKVVELTDTKNAILDEAQRNYDILFLGTAQEFSGQAVFNPFIDSLVRLSPCISMVVHLPENYKSHHDFRRILVPSTGSTASRYAVEFAYWLAHRKEDRVVLINVVEQSAGDMSLESPDALPDAKIEAAKDMLKAVAAKGESRGVEVEDIVRSGPLVEEIILETASSKHVDLIIVGTGVRAGSERLFVGPKIEKLLRQSPCPIIVLNTPL